MSLLPIRPSGGKQRTGARWTQIGSTKPAQNSRFQTNQAGMAGQSTLFPQPAKLVRVFEGFWYLTVHYGFVEMPDLPSALRAAKDLGCPIDLDDASTSANTTPSFAASRAGGCYGGGCRFLPCCSATR